MSNTLHILTKAPGSDQFNLCLQVARESDCILLIQDAVYALRNTDTSMGKLLASNKIAIKALSEDISARGITPKGGSVDTIGYQDFVELTAKHQRSVTW